MKTTQLGDNAFPIQGLHNDEYANGISIRDYFAAKAMQGICAHPDTWGLLTNDIASYAYVLADAMIKARES